MRRELINWFRSNAKPLADAYEGAVRLIEDGAFPGRITFICHAIRDIGNRLAEVLDQDIPSSRVEYDAYMDKIAGAWTSPPMLGADAADLDAAQNIAIEYGLAKQIDSLVLDHRRRRERPSPFDLLFRILMRNEPSRASANERIVADFKATCKWFMDRAHLRRRTPCEFDEADLQMQFSRFEGILHSFVGHFYTGMKELDDILRHANRVGA